MKRILIQIFAWLSYYGGIDTLFYWLNRRAKRVLTFHNVLPDALWRPFANGVSHKESDFIAIINEVGRRYRFSTDLSDASTATITFDDGYRNQYEVAGAVLEKRGIPAILFISGDNAGTESPDDALVVDKLLHWIGYAPNELIEGGRMRYWSRTVRPRFFADTATKGKATLDWLCSLYPIEKIWEQLPPEYLRLRMTGIGERELEELRQKGWLVGWHTKSHFPLAMLADAEISNEIDSPRQFRNIVFSYPYGETETVDERCIEIVRNLGYPCAVSNQMGSTALTGNFFRPRMPLPSDKYRLHMRLSGLEHFIKTRKLLPIT